MKQLVAILTLILFFGCNNGEDEYRAPENALDAGREFIQSTLKGKFTKADKYMLQDEDNKYLLSKFAQQYSKLSERERAAFANASINVAEVDDVAADSVTVISFSNSYKKTPQKIKVVRSNNDWKVDFKYTFSGNL